MRKLLSMLLLLSTIQPLAGCSTLQPTQLVSKTLAGMPRVQNSSKAPCVIQREIAAQNTYLGVVEGTIDKGVVYSAACDMKSSKSAPASPVS